MRPVTVSHLSRSSVRSSGADAMSMRSRRSGIESTSRPFTGRSSRIDMGKIAVNLPTKEVNVSARPVTAAGGLGGLQKHSTTKFHQNRQILDASYFLQLLHTKEKSITDEINKLNAKIQKVKLEQVPKDAEVFHRALLKEVRDLEGILADHSVTNDKMRRGCDPEEIEDQLLQTRIKNEESENILDEIYLSKQKEKDKVEKLEGAVEKLHKSIQLNFQGSDPALYQQYTQFLEQIQDLQSQGKTMEMQLEEMRDKLGTVEAKMTSSSAYQIQKLYEQEEVKLQKLNDDSKNIDEDLHIASMSIEDAKAYLLDKVKSIQANVHKIDAKEKNTNMMIEDHREMYSDLQKRKSKTQPQDKIASMANIDQSIKATNDAITKIIDDLKQKQNEKQTLVKRLEEDIEATQQVKPTKKGLKEMDKDVEFRTKHLEKSKETMTRLVEQKEKRLREVEMVENLETKIKEEEKNLKGKIEKMQAESEKYSDLNQAQESAEMTKIYLVEMKRRYVQRRNFMKSKVKSVAAATEQNKLALQKNTVWKSLKDLEEKVRRQGQIVYSLKVALETKERKSNYNIMKKDCLDLLNDLLVDN